MQHRLTTEITHFLSELPEEERIAAINEFRMAIHSADESPNDFYQNH